MSFVPKAWKDAPDTSTPLSAAALVDLETRLAAYADSGGSGGSFVGRERFDPASYGAAGDWNGSTGTDDTTAMQAALTAAANANGILVLSKMYKTTAALTASKPCAIIGESPAPRYGGIGYIPRGQLVATHTNGDVLTLSGRGAGDVGYLVQDIGVDSPTAGSSHSAGAGIHLVSTINAVVDRCTAFNRFDGILADVSDGNGWANRIQNCEIALMRHSGIRANGVQGMFQVDSCQITNGLSWSGYGTGAALDFPGSSIVTPQVSRCDCPGWTNGVYVSGYTQYARFVNVITDTCIVGWNIAGGNDIEMVACYASASPGAGTHGVKFNGTNFGRWIGGRIDNANSGTFSTAAFDVRGGATMIEIIGAQIGQWASPSAPAAFTAPALLLAPGHGAVKFKDNMAVPTSGAITLESGDHSNTHIEGNMGMAAISGTVGSGTGNRITANQNSSYTVTNW